MRISTIAIATIMATTANAQQSAAIGKSDIKLTSDLMTPEALWAMGRIGAAAASPDGKTVAYQVGYYSVEQNKSRQVIYAVDTDTKTTTLLTTGDASETDPAWTADGRIAFLRDGQIWTMDADGANRQQMSHSADGIEGFLFSPDGSRVVLIKSIPFHDIIQKNPDDLPLATGRLVTDLMYRHWDHYVESIPHPFLADVTTDGITDGTDILAGEPYECPGEPWGGTEQIAWSPDSRQIAYTCRKKTGLQYAISTDTDIYLYDIESATTRNLCKEEGYVEIMSDPTHTMKDQPVNDATNLKNNPGYDTNPQFSPDGNYVAWQSMARDGYESDINRLCVYDLSTGEKTYVSDAFESNVDAFFWNADSESLTFIGVWHACINIYQTNLKGEVRQITGDQADYVAISPANDGDNILATRQSLSAPNDLYIVSPGKSVEKTRVERLTDENAGILGQLSTGEVREYHATASDGADLLCWVVLPPHFDASRRYPTLLFCEGGPQSPVSQFWSYRWNFQIMAANGYVVVAPNRRGLPGFGKEWNEAVSGDWTGMCMQDLLATIDFAADSLPFVDKDRLGAVGASFGGYSVYWLAGHHEGRFKCFIAHDGAFNLESMYTDTEEEWFSNWEYDDAFWKDTLTDNARNTYANSPHKAVDNWDTPILCIHGEKDYRINYNQGMGAFNAARMKGIPAELLIFPDENHWVLKPQNGILWQRTFFNWLDRWLK